MDFCHFQMEYIRDIIIILSFPLLRLIIGSKTQTDPIIEIVVVLFDFLGLLYHRIILFHIYLNALLFKYMISFCETYCKHKMQTLQILKN